MQQLILVISKLYDKKTLFKNETKANKHLPFY
jgi:hypothetical protein